MFNTDPVVWDFYHGEYWAIALRIGSGAVLSWVVVIGRGKRTLEKATWNKYSLDFAKQRTKNRIAAYRIGGM